MLTVHHGRTARRLARTGPIARIGHALAGAAALGRSRAALADLDDHLLHDIGVTRHEARKEARRPIWDAPAHWFR